MAINISTIFISPAITERILNVDAINAVGGSQELSSVISLLTEFILLIVTFGIAVFFFAPVWFIKDSGIIYSNKEKIENSQELFTIKSIGDWFQTILKSYAGIGAIITYILIVYNFISTAYWNIPGLILWLGLPFYLMLSLIPVLICNDLIKNHRINYVINLGEKLGISHTAIISFKLKKNN